MHVLGSPMREEQQLLGRAKQRVKQQEPHVGHMCTKVEGSSFLLSASADKRHMGEGDAQEAAHRGAIDWSRIWLGKSEDISEDVMQLLEAVDLSAMREAGILLPLWRSERRRNSGEERVRARIG